MIKASLIYTVVTILLALVDAIRIKKAKGVVGNINHELSFFLAAFGGSFLMCVMFWGKGEFSFKRFVEVVLLLASFGFIRLVIYDIFLNLFRRLKINYQSSTTNSYVDNHTTLITFWEKRAIGLAGWVGVGIVHYLIFKK